MPKLKTKRGAAKRMSFTSKGKVKYTKAFRRHLLTHKRRKRIRQMHNPGEVGASDSKRVKRMLPYDN